MTYSKSMGGKVKGKKTLRKNKSGKRRGSKKARRTYRRRKARGGDRSYGRPSSISPLVKNKNAAINHVERFCLSGDGGTEMCQNTTEIINKRINAAKDIDEIVDILESNNVPSENLMLTY